MAYVYLLLGSNVGDRFQHLQQATTLLQEEAGKVLKQSAIYETAAWGITDQDSFLNQALLLETPLDHFEMLVKIKDIELATGRVNTKRWGPRIIDIDILFWDDAIIDHPELQVPHPQLANRRFALAPMAELAPGLQHPVHHKTIRQLLATCPDKLAVQPVEPVVR